MKIKYSSWILKVPIQVKLVIPIIKRDKFSIDFLFSIISFNTETNQTKRLNVYQLFIFCSSRVFVCVKELVTNITIVY